MIQCWRLWKSTSILERTCHQIINGLNIWAASWQNQQNGMCAQRRLRSAWASAQSDQSLRCPGWSESSLGAKVIMLVLSWGGSYWLDISVSIKTNFFLEEYQISKQTLSTLYCTYIRPLLEYASDVWDGCSQTDENSHSFTGICFIKFVILWNWVGNHREELIRSYLLCIRSSITKLRNTLLIFRPT